MKNIDFEFIGVIPLSDHPDTFCTSVFQKSGKYFIQIDSGARPKYVELPLSEANHCEKIEFDEYIYDILDTNVLYVFRSRRHGYQLGDRDHIASYLKDNFVDFSDQPFFKVELAKFIVCGAIKTVFIAPHTLIY